MLVRILLGPTSHLMVSLWRFGLSFENKLLSFSVLSRAAHEFCTAMASTRHSVVEEAPADSIDEHFAIKDSFHKLQLAEQPVIAGALKKLSPKRLGPFLSWQSRYCVLMPVCGHFRYYKSEEKFAKDGEPSGIIPLNTVSEVRTGRSVCVCVCGVSCGAVGQGGAM
jgi:hypothetical protein